MNNQVQNVNNQVKQQPKRELNPVKAITSLLLSDASKNRITAILGAKEGDKMISGLISNIQQTPALASCSPESLVAGALAAHALDLDFALQQAYLIPFKNTKKGITEAQFCIGYKGYIQMAERTGEFELINAVAIKEGELVDYDILDNEFKFNYIKPLKERNKAKTEYYAARFKTIKGLKKTIVWPVEDIIAHAKEYSTSYVSDLRYNTNKSFWSRHFDKQACKTLIRQLLSKDAPLSTELKQTMLQDMAVLRINKETNQVEVDNYIDNDSTNQEVEVVEEKTYTESENQEPVNQEPIINDAQIKNLCETIINKTNLTVPEVLANEGIDNINTLTVAKYNELMKRIGA